MVNKINYQTTKIKNNYRNFNKIIIQKYKIKCTIKD